MSEQRKQLIQQLCYELKPVKPAAKTTPRSMIWMLVAIVFSAAAMLLIAPFRTGWLSQLLGHPLMQLEFVFGLAAICNLAALVFISGIPGHPRYNQLLNSALALTLVWIGLQVVAVFFPALPATMADKRPHCFIEVFAFALPPLLLGAMLMRRLLPLGRWRSGALLGLAAGVIPAWVMQLACMYSPLHSLQFHLAPALLVVPLGALLLRVLQRRHGGSD